MLSKEEEESILKFKKMKTSTLIFALTLSIGLFTACTDKKKSDKKKSKEVITSVKDTIDVAEKRRLDSIRQVKEHGHAH